MQALYNCEVLFDCFSKPTNGGKKNKHCHVNADHSPCVFKMASLYEHKNWFLSRKPDLTVSKTCFLCFNCRFFLLLLEGGGN